MLTRTKYLRKSLPFFWLLAFGCLGLANSSFAQQTNVIWRTAQGSSTYNNNMLMIVDEPSQKVYLQLSGPADRWFAWGFNNNRMLNTYALIVLPGAGGPTIQERRLGDHNPGTQLTSQFRLVSSCTANNRIYLLLERAMTGLTTSHHTFIPNLASLPMIWAVGSSSTLIGHTVRTPFPISPAGAHVPRPRFTRITESNDVASVTITNLPVGITNRLEVGSTLLSRDWEVASAIIRMPGCNPPTLTFVTNVNFSITNQDRAFFRIHR